MALEYKVVEVREGLVGDKIDGPKLESLLNQHAREGWHYKSMIPANDKGRYGPLGTEGLLIVFERED